MPSRWSMFALFIHLLLILLWLAPGQVASQPSSTQQSKIAPKEAWATVFQAAVFYDHSHKFFVCADGYAELVTIYYSPPDTIRTPLPLGQERALAFLRNLFQSDFFTLPARFDARAPTIMHFYGFGLGIGMSGCDDCGELIVTLHEPNNEHTVTVSMPAPTAPKALHDALTEYVKIVKENEPVRGG